MIAFSVVGQSTFTHEMSPKQGFKDSRVELGEDSLLYPALLNFKNSRSRSSFHPLFEYLYASDNQAGNLQRAGIGTQFIYRSKRIDAGFSFMYSRGEYMRYRSDLIRQNDAIPAFGSFTGEEVFESRYWDAHLTYKPADFFEAEVGYGRKFIGHGHRSLLNSDFTAPYPYLKLQTSFWKLTYSNLFAAQSSGFGLADGLGRNDQKFTATHFLELKLFDKLSVGVFETVVWQADEGNFFRGVDPNYLNPVIFYRPVEFSVGSSDNVLIGLNVAFDFNENHQFYAQALLDEFLLAEIRADVSQQLNPDEDIRSGWWGNKYGLQFGWKMQDLFGKEGFNARLEYNLVRPYTYAHSNATQAYSHLALPLAHPLGANFQEAIIQLSYRKRKWRWHAQYNNALQGRSAGVSNLGENIERSNSTRSKEYENFIGQGVSARTQYFETYISRRFQKLWGAELSLGYVWRQQDLAEEVSLNNMVYFGIRTNLIRQTFDF